MTERGFIRSEKLGKERTYYPIIQKEDYLKFETGNFMKQYHENSVSSFVASMYDNQSLKKEDLEELLQWAKEKME